MRVVYKQTARTWEHLQVHCMASVGNVQYRTTLRMAEGALDRSAHFVSEAQWLYTTPKQQNCCEDLPMVAVI